MLEGECFCGTVRYQIQGELKNARSCHCSRCRKAFSGAASAFAEIADRRSGAASQFQWTHGEDQLRRFSTGHDWGLAFCGVCGSTLCGLYRDEVMGVTLGTINGDPGVVIEKHIYVGSKAPWDHIGGTAPQFAARGDEV